VNAPTSPLILVLEHDPSDPPLRLGEWLTDAGARLEIRRPYAGDPIPDGPAAFDGVVSLGGEMGADDDDVAPWLPATRRLLAAATADGTPTLGVCLGAQLLAVATGGEVRRGADGPEIGAHLAAKRDAATADPLFADLPMTPDVMHYHYDVITRLPPGAVLLLTSNGYPNQAFRVGDAAWGVQFHIETTAADVRAWGRSDPDGPIAPVAVGADQEGLDQESVDQDGADQGSADRQRAEASGRLGLMLDEAEEAMTEVWGGVARRFVEITRQPRSAPDSRGGPAGSSLRGRRLPLGQALPPAGP
jgi:GMP synthase-like glutamine amidotransferase